MESIARHLIRAIRGDVSQEALSRRLGYTSNPVQDWEGGRRFPTAAEMFRACSVRGIDVPGVFEAFATGELPAPLGLHDAQLAAWLNSLRTDRSVARIAADVGRSRSRVSRWFAGVTRPRLPDFLRLVDALTHRLEDLVALLVEIDRVPELADAWNRKQAARMLAFDHPWTEAVVRVIETSDYQRLRQHVPGWIGQRLQIDSQEVALCLERLVAGGILELRKGRYRSLRPLTIDTQTTPATVWTLKEHWLRASMARLPHRGPADLYSYNVVSLSRRDLDRLRQLHTDYFKQVRALVAASEPVEVAALVTLQLVEFCPDPEGGEPHPIRSLQQQAPSIDGGSGAMLSGNVE